MLRLVTLIGGLVLLWAVFAFDGRPHAPVIEGDVRVRTAAAVGDAGYDGVTVAGDGRDVTVTGSVVASADIDAAEATASAVRGVRVVSNELRIAAGARLTVSPGLLD